MKRKRLRAKKLGPILIKFCKQSRDTLATPVLRNQTMHFNMMNLRKKNKMRAKMTVMIHRMRMRVVTMRVLEEN